MIFRNKLLAKVGKVVGRLPVDVKDLIAGPDRRRGVHVAVQAPAHQQRWALPRQRHLMYLPVTGHTSDAFSNVRTVIEIGVTGQVIDTYPLQGLARRKTIADGGQHRAILPDLRMAGHTDFGGGYSSEGGVLDRGVTVATVDAEVADMMLVAEGDRLCADNADASCVGSARHDQQKANQPTNEKYSTNNTASGNAVGAAMENLSHRPRSLRKRIKLRVGVDGGKLGNLRFQWAAMD